MKLIELIPSLIDIQESIPDGILFDYLSTMKRLEKRPSWFFGLFNRLKYNVSDYETFIRRFPVQLRALFIMRIVAKEFGIEKYKENPTLWINLNLYIISSLCGISMEAREEEILKSLKLSEWAFLRKRIHFLTGYGLEDIFQVYQTHFGI